MTNFDWEHLMVREIRATDIDDVLSLQNELILSPWTKIDYQNEIQRTDSTNLAMVYDEEIVGFIIMRVISGTDGEIYNIAVKRKYQKKGIGKKLLSTAIQIARSKENIKQIWLEVRKSNRNASSFYQNQGFVITGLRKNFYSNPLEDAFLMKLDMENYSPQKSFKT